MLFGLFVITLISTAQEKPATTISGYMFGDYFYNITRDSSLGALSNVATGGKKDFNGFQFRRIYLTFDNVISETFSTRLRLEGTTGAPVIKDAYLKWKRIFSAADLSFGIQPTPAFEVSESYWGFRSLEKTILDLRSIVASRDFGVSLKGKATNDGMIKYWVLYGNNSNIGAESDKYKRLYAHVDVTPSARMRMTLYADYKMQAQINDPASTSIPKKTLGADVLTSAFFLGYQEKNQLSLGTELFVQRFDHGYVHGTAPVIAELRQAVGLSLFGTFTINPTLSLLGRYDYYDPNTSASNDLRHFLIAGAQWSAEKNVSIIPNVTVETYEAVPTASGTRSIEPSVTGHITLYYAFL